ncbi:MAG: hypothetical protein NTW66_01155 [Candidatus Magasanikbacteria bacterium]|nr:hypothetical protein [Candidatus Magasanikbacteria bacterium]
MELSQQVLEKIEKENMHPSSRYAVFLKRSIFWSLTATALVVGSIAVSITFFSIANAEWDLWSRATGSVWKYVFFIFPYFWLLIFVGFILLAHYNLRHTKYGYRFTLSKVIIIYVVSTVVLGGVFYRLGLGHMIEESIADSTSFYHHLQGDRMMWVMPDQGLLGGKVEGIDDLYNFILTDQDGRRWQVAVSGTIGVEYTVLGAKIKIIGERFGTSSFRAVEIRSWCGCGGCDQQVAPACAHATATCGAGSGCGCGE